MHNDPVDVVIVGAGAAGGVLAAELAEAGMSVVVLEAGPFWDPQHDWASDELATQNQGWRETRITAGENPLKLAKNNSGRGVGGGTVHFNGVALRFRESDFRTYSTDGVAVDWPLTYDDLEPYYTKIEQETAVSGPRDWPWPPARPPYPYPERNPLSGPAMLFRKGCEGLGIKSVPAPLFILSAPFAGRPACINRGFCVQGCMVNAKFSTLITYVPKAISHGAKVKAQAHVTRINVDQHGRATGVNYLYDGEEHEQKARMVIVAAFAIETPRLLLMSACEKYPDGLANSSGMVGRRLMTHLSHDVWARFDQETRPYKGTPVLATTQDYYATDKDNDYVRGFTIHAHGFRPIEFAKGIAVPNLVWGPRFQELLRDYNYYVKLTMVGEVLPYDDNRVTLSPDVTDRLGLPAPKVTFSYGENEKRMAAAGIRRMKAIMEVANGVPMFDGADTAHLMGGCVMGNDPAASVVDSFGQSHDIPNLFVAGAAVFPTSTGNNPTLTVMALAARTADRIKELAAQRHI